MSLVPSIEYFDWGHPSRYLHKWFDPVEQFIHHPFTSRRHRDPETILSQPQEKFEACIDVKHFKPSEISVKIVNNLIVVEGKHEEKEDPHGCVTRHFLRKYPIPEDHDPKDVFSNLSIDGFLTVVAPKNTVKQKSEINVPIVITGPLHPTADVKPKKKKSSTDSAELEHGIIESYLMSMMPPITT